MNVKRTLTGVAAAVVAAGTLVAIAPAASAADLGRVDFGCDMTADDIYGDLVIVGSTVYVDGAVGDTFTIDEDNSDDCLVLNHAGASVNTLADLGGFVSYGSLGTLLTDPLRYSDSVTVEYVINGPGTFLIQALDSSYYTIVVNGGTPVATTSPEVWFQSYGRASANTACLDGWSPSYAMWPNDGIGGWVCDRGVRKYG